MLRRLLAYNERMKIVRKTKHLGFTLIEILIVLAIVAILAAIIFVVFARVREKGRSAVCQSNLKQIALAMQQYIQDNNGRYPHNVYETIKGSPQTQYFHWNHALSPYAIDKTIFRCPTSKAIEDSRVPHKRNDRLLMPRDTSYDYNYLEVNDIPAQLDNRPTSTQMQGSLESKVALSATTVLNYDRPWEEEVVEDGSITLHDPKNVISSCGQSVRNSTMHSDGANYSFADSHVKWMTPSQIGEMKCAN